MPREATDLAAILAASAKTAHTGLSRGLDADFQHLRSIAAAQPVEARMAY